MRPTHILDNMTINQNITKAVRDHQEISIRKLAKMFKMRQQKVLDICEDLAFNVNIGIQIGGGIHIFACIGDYTIEDLS